MPGVPHIEAKVVILGAQGVGKTSIVLRYVGKVFSNRVNPTIGASFFTFTMDLETTKIKIQLWDTAGQERFRAMAPMYYRKANAAIIVYDITSQRSFEQAKDWIDELHRNIGKDIALCIVGNKVDLEKDARQVSTEKGRQFAKSLNALFTETSAALDINIKEMFLDTAQQVVDMQKREQDLKQMSMSSSVPAHQLHQTTSSNQHLQPAGRWLREQQESASSAAQFSNVVLDSSSSTSTQEKPESKGWCCWR